jgi:hypothetical protein
MSGEEVAKIMGKPASVQPIEAPTGKAEIWVFDTILSEKSERVLTGSRPITTVVVGADGVSRLAQIGTEETYRTERRKRIRRTSLLIYNDALLNLKSAIEEQRAYE